MRSTNPQSSPAPDTVNGRSGLDGVVLPTENRPNVEKAMAYNPDLASAYLRHTLIGDPLMDEMAEELAPVPQADLTRFIHAGMEQDVEVMRAAPKVLRDFFIDYPPPEPPRLDYEEFAPGIRAFHRDSGLILAGFAAGVLVDGFGTLIAKSFVMTGRVFDSGVRRLRQNNRHFLEVFFPGGLERAGDGWKLSVRIRFIHARMRRLLHDSGEWDTEAWGVPINSAHTGYAAACFSARTIKHSESVGVSYTQEERDSIMAVWRYTAYLMGIPETILFTNEAEALAIHKIASICEPPIADESVVMANAIINSAPLVAGVEDPDVRKTMVEKEIYPISRALIGDDLADQMRFPKSRKIGLLFQFRMLQRFRKLWAKIRRKPLAADSFGALLSISAFDEAGISYRMPDHAHDERSTPW